MVNRYKKSILFLLGTLHRLREEPFIDGYKWLLFQEALIKKTIYIEKRIRLKKEEKKRLIRSQKNPEQRLTKEESKVVKEKIKLIEFHLDEYDWLLKILKSIGDGIAFTFIDKLDIKPQNFKESPGFMSEKKGLKNELKALRYTYSQGGIAILNDLTSVLRYADLTIITGDKFIGIEIKSSDNYNERVKRQEEKAQQLYNYLAEDITTGLYDDSSTMQRIDIKRPQKNYINEFNKLIIETNENGIKSTHFENGMMCIVVYNVFDEEIMNNYVKDSGFDKPYAFHLNMFKFMEQGYYPFSLSFINPKHYWDFLEGQLNVFMFIDFKTIKKIGNEINFTIERSKKQLYAFDLVSNDKKFPVSKLSISEHFFFRTFMEFVSLDYIIKGGVEYIINYRP